MRLALLARAALLCSSAGSFACQADSFVTLPSEAGFETIFLVTSRADGPTTVEGPFSTQESVAFVPPDEGGIVHLVSISNAELAGVEPRLDVEHPDFQLMPPSGALAAEPACRPSGLLVSEADSLERIERALEDVMAANAVRVHTLDLDANVFVPSDQPPPGDWSILHSIRPCLAQTTLEVAPFMGPNFPPAQMLAIAHLDADHLLATTGDQLLRLERGANRPDFSWPLASVRPLPSDEAWLLEEIRPFYDETQALHALARVRHFQFPGGPAVLLETQLLDLKIGTATVSIERTLFSRSREETGANELLDLRAIDLNDAGDFVAVGFRYWVTGNVHRQGVSVHDDPDSLFDGFDVRWTDDTDGSAVIASRDGVWVGDPKLGPRGVRKQVLSSGGPVPASAWERVESLRRSDDRLVLYAGGANSQVVRRDTSWDRLPLWPDTVGRDCAPDRECGRDTTTTSSGERQIRSMHAMEHGDDERLFFTFADCDGVYLSSGSQRCAISAPLFEDSNQVRRYPTNSVFVRDSSRLDDRVVISVGTLDTEYLIEVRIGQ